MSRYNAATCACYVGHTVSVHTASGIHRGRIDRVGSRGIYFRPMVARPRTVSGVVTSEFLLLEQLPAVHAEQVYWGYRGYGYGGWGWGAGFWIPFLSILALSPLFFW